MTPPRQEPVLSPPLLARLDTDDPQRAWALLTEERLLSLAAAGELTDAALLKAEAAPESAARWLALAHRLQTALDGPPELEAQIAYAQARLRLRAGDLGAAEALIRQAQALWQNAGAGPALARSFLGLTQILAMQGRYAEAEVAIQQAIDGLPAGSVQAAQARINLANLLRRQERHQAALEEYAGAQAIYQAQLQREEARQDRPAAAATQTALARLAVNQANALMYLDRPAEAENALRAASQGFAEAGDRLNQGRTFTNLGTLYLRTGRYSLALAALQQAGDALLQSGPDEPGKLSEQADVLYLERANAYIALNLVPEAIEALEQAIRLFEKAGQPYELGQSNYSLGLLRLHNGQERLAASALSAAQAQFAELGNPYWQNRVALAQAILDFRQGSTANARKRIAHLLAQNQTEPGPAQSWDAGLRAEVRLLESRLALVQNDPGAARRAIDQAGQAVGQETGDGEAQPFSLPHLRMRWEHLRGCVALAEGKPDAAIGHFRAAIGLLESQRVSLPLEEFKTAFVEDKDELYGDLLFALLAEEGQPEPPAAAFAISEESRARALRERLAAAGESTPRPSDAGAGRRDAQAQAVRSQLHWLYSQLQESADSEQMAARRREIQSQEALLQQMEWQRPPLPGEAGGVDLAGFQQGLAENEQAIVYFSGRSLLSAGEVMAFVVDRERVRLVRRLAQPDEIVALAGELRFQLGRVELGPAYAERHRERLLAGVRGVLGALYERLIAPLADGLWAERLLFVPHAVLHQIPLHSLWDGAAYLLERFECSYAPSASLAWHSRNRRRPGPGGYTSWAGLALTDPAIPGARREVEQAGALFAHSRLFLDEAASRAGLADAAQADILHLATHGLFRPDNPFFSALKLADGWIDVREIYRLPLAARLVVLSACESGAGRVRGGDEVIGLARGFLGAGAHSLLVTLWNVHDASAADLSAGFYGHLQAGSSPAAALRQAQQAAIAAGRHPYFWAPFLMIE